MVVPGPDGNIDSIASFPFHTLIFNHAVASSLKNIEDGFIRNCQNWLLMLRGEPNS